MTHSAISKIKNLPVIIHKIQDGIIVKIIVHNQIIPTKNLKSLIENSIILFIFVDNKV